MAGKRKFCERILPPSHQTRKKELASTTPHLSALQFGWGSSIPKPIDYEFFISKNRSSIISDPYRELILIPTDDIKVIRLPYMHRIAKAGLPPPHILTPETFALNPLGRLSVSFIGTTEWAYVHQNSVLYRGHFSALPRTDVVEKLLEPLNTYWFAVDHPESSVSSGSDSNSKLPPTHPTSVTSRSWTSAFVPNRHYRLSMEPTPSSTVPVAKPARRIKTLKEAERPDHAMFGVTRDLSPPADLKIYSECSLAILTRKAYTDYMLDCELVSHGGSVSKDAKALLLKPYCLRQIQSEELSGRLGIADRLVPSGDSAVVAGDRRLFAGLHIIAPIGWRNLGSTTINDQQIESPILLLNTIESVCQIGDNWLKLARVSDFHSSDNLWTGDMFIYFADPTPVRQNWLRLIRIVINTERSRKQQWSACPSSIEHITRPVNWSSRQQNHTGASSAVGGVGETNGTNFSQPTEAVSIRAALQRFENETESMLIHQRQKGRLKLITLYPEVRYTYEKTAALAKDRYLRKSSTSQTVLSKHSQSVHRKASIHSLSTHDPTKTTWDVTDLSPSRLTIPDLNNVQPFLDRTGPELCGTRFLATCLSLKSRVQVHISSGAGENASSQTSLDNPEPYFVTMFLVDVQDGRRVSEDFCWNPNTPLVDSMIPKELFKKPVWSTSTTHPNSSSSAPSQIIEVKPTTTSQQATRPSRGLAPPPPSTVGITSSFPSQFEGIHSLVGSSLERQPDSLSHCRSAIFSIPTEGSNLNTIYLVCRVDKVFSGAIGAALDRYTKAFSVGNGADGESKLMINYHRSMVPYCRQLGRYRMPFAWGAKPLICRSASIPLFKADSGKLSEPTFIQQIQSLARLLDSYSPPDGDVWSIRTEPSATAADKRSSGISKSSWQQSMTTSELSMEVVERQLKTQWSQLQLEVFISKLLGHTSDCVDHVELSDSKILTPDLVHLSSTVSSHLIPPVHPTLRPDEVIREIEPLWDYLEPTGGSSWTGDSWPSGSKGDADTGGHQLSVTQQQHQSQLTQRHMAKVNRETVYLPSSVTSQPISGSGVQSSADSGRRHFEVSIIRSRPTSLDRSNSPAAVGAAVAAPSLAAGVTNPTTTPDLVPFTQFIHSLYVSPKSLNLSVKHHFPRARNLSCFVELRSVDDLLPTSSLQVFHTRPSSRQPLLDSWSNTIVTYHDTSPHFNDTIKLCMPLQLEPKHHLLFRFYHVSADSAASLPIKDRSAPSKRQLESATGFAWIPVLGVDGNLNSGTFQLPIASEIQPGYLKYRKVSNNRSSIQLNQVGSMPTDSPSSSSGAGGWLENGRTLFTVQLDWLSSIYTRDPTLSRFYRACEELLACIPSLSPPLPSADGKIKTNRVTFYDDLKSNEAAEPGTNTSSDVACVTRLCNAIKSLLLIHVPEFIRFLPSVLNQFMEIILVGAATGQQWASSLDPDRFSWLLGSYGSPSSSTNKPNDLLRTTLGTLAMLLSELVSHTSSCDVNVSSLPRVKKRTPNPSSPRQPREKSDLLRAYVNYAFNSIAITTSCTNHYLRDPVISQSTRSFQAVFNPPESPSPTIPLHHALVRCLVLLLADVNRVPHMLTHLFANLWFLFALICKAMAQHVCSTQKTRSDRSGDTCFSIAFSDDLSLFIRLFGARVYASTTATTGLNRHGASTTYSSPSITKSTASSSNAASDMLRTFLEDAKQVLDSRGKTDFKQSPADQLVYEIRHVPSLESDVNVHEIISATARFLVNLFNLMDRGFVMKRVRDLLISLEVDSSMPAQQIDSLNELKFHLLNGLSQHECFIQLNLPALQSAKPATASAAIDIVDRLDDEQNLPTDQGLDPVNTEYRLTDRYVTDHFLIGSILSSIDCLLAGCVNTGSWATGMSAHHLYRQPAILLRNLLAKHCLDPRYANSKPCQARIAALYLPLVSLILSNPAVFESPGTGFKSILQMGDLQLNTGGSGSSVQHRTFKHGMRDSKQLSSEISSAASSRPQSMISDSSVETMLASSQSESSSIVSRGSGGSLGSEASKVSNTSSAAYLTKDNQVATHILNQIAGLPVKQRPTRMPKFVPSSQLNGIQESQLSSNFTGSTLTLTETDISGRGDNLRTNGTASSVVDDEDDDEEVLALSDMYRGYEKTFEQQSIGSGSIRILDNEFNDDWTKQVLSLVDVVPSAPRKRPSLPTDHLQGAVNLAHTSINSSASDLMSRLQSPFVPHQHRFPADQRQTSARRLTDQCQRELFVCMLHILNTVTEQQLVAFFEQLTEQERTNFLQLLNLAIQHLQYCGKERIQRYDQISSGSISHSRPGAVPTAHRKSSIVALGMDAVEDASGMSTSSEYKAAVEANLATEAGLIMLDLLFTFQHVHRQDLLTSKATSPMFKGIVEVYISLLMHNPSDCLIRSTFSALRLFVNRHAKVLFSESTEVLCALCLVALRCANQCVSGTGADVIAGGAGGPSVTPDQLRLEACSFLYKLWKSSYETYEAVGFSRIHLQTIISVSKLVSEISPTFDTSLSILHNLVDTDMCHTWNTSCSADRSERPNYTAFWKSASTRQLFADEADDLIRRLRTVLSATQEMRLHSDDPERLIDLQYSLAKSYSSNPALRRTWLEEIAKLHMKAGNLAELAMTKLHIAALMVEYLRRRGSLDREFPQSCEAFSIISSNIPQEESGLRADCALLEIPYTQKDLLLDINEATATLEAAGLYEAVRPVYNLILPTYEAGQDYATLALIFHHIAKAYERTAKAEASGYRLFAVYFKVTFYGNPFESLNGKSFIYRTDACQKLSTMYSDLHKRYSTKYGSMEFLRDYTFDQKALDANKAYIHITYVEPYRPNNPDSVNNVQPLTSYEKHHDVNQFVFESPFILQPGLSATQSLLTNGPRRSDDLTIQWKRQTILTTVASFPHIRRRLEVLDISETDLAPIDAAIDSIRSKNLELLSHIVPLNALLSASPTSPTVTEKTQRSTVTEIGIDSPLYADRNAPRTGQAADQRSQIPLLMDMQLQGALLPTVNAGPMAYAEAFLKKENQYNYPTNKVAQLRQLFFNFLTICLTLLTRYEQLMTAVQEPKYRVMRQALDQYRVDLSNLLKEEVKIDENDLKIGSKCCVNIHNN